MSASITKVLQTEHGHLRKRRGESPAPAGDKPELDAHRLKPFGVSFSGGGIRSATFSLGIIQGLAESNLLSRIDYLSTVSGGGYIGSWLHGFIKNHCQGDLRLASDELSPTDNPVPKAPHTDPLMFLRKYSNYLAPRPGLFSADSWVIGTIWLRNVLLNQLILVPALSAVVLAALLFYFVQQWPVAQYLPNVPFFVMPLVAVVLLAATLPFAIKNLSEIVRRCDLDDETPKADGKSKPGASSRAGSWAPPILIFAASVVLGTGDTGARIEESTVRWFSGLLLLWLMFFALLFVLQTFGGFRRRYKKTHKKMGGAAFWRFVHPIWMSAACAGLMVMLLHLLWTAGPWEEWARVTLAPPLVAGAVMLSVSLLIGLMGADYPDGAREWLARSGALLALLSAAWLVLFGVAFYGPYAVAYALGEYGKTTMAGIAAWIATGAAGIFAGKSSRTDGPDEGGKTSMLDRLVALAPPLVMVAYLLLVSLAVHEVFAATLNIPPRPRETPAAAALQVDVRVPPPAAPVEISINRSAVPGVLERFFADAKAFAAGYHDPFTKGEDVERRLVRLVLLLFGSLFIAAVASARININEFSLHNFYKNRLVRCYLGASNAATRQPNRFTGFDPQDDFALSELVPDRGYFGPYPIVNTTLNLNVGSELSQQERKGASFIMTPAFCGFDAQDSPTERPKGNKQFEQFGYRQTREDEDGVEMGYSDPKGPTVGQAMAISGAAASPNAGYTTSGPMAFLLTIFDARLGWWLGNPRWRDASRMPGPAFSLKYLLAELTANTTARTRFVNLSDGGHFDNLGLYELVRRRCRYIIVCDGEQDGKLTFGSLGGAVRKCRADFGVEINIDPTPIKLTNGRSSAHCVVGTIIYPENDDPGTQEPMSKASGGLPPNVEFTKVQIPTPRARGWLLYLKSSLTGNEPADVVQYQSENPEFPHESTGDQFFSESQFESYRRLGLHIFREAFEGVLEQRIPGTDRPDEPPPLTQVFQDLTTKWYARIPTDDASASRLNDSYSKTVKRLGEAGLSEMLESALAGLKEPPKWEPGAPSEAQFVYVVEQLQLMENVFFEFKFEHRAHRANPRSRGWMTVFRQWAHSPGFDGVWQRVQHTYNPVFQDFITRLQRDGIDDVPIQN